MSGLSAFRNSVFLGAFALIATFSTQTFAGDALDNALLRKEISNETATQTFKLELYKDQRAIVVISQGVSCPVMRRNYPGFLALEKEFSRDRFKFIFINGNLQDKRADIAEEAVKFGISNRIGLDLDQAWLKSLKLNTVGEVAVLLPRADQPWEIVYRGGLSDRVNFNRTLAKAKDEYLRKVLLEVRAGKAVSRSTAPIYGCAIAFK